jgi:hypothetical protein
LRILEQVEERVAKLKEKKKAILKKKNRWNSEKMMEYYMASHYLAPQVGPFGPGYPSLHLYLQINNLGVQ